MPKALVTGAAGFIGSHLTERLLAQGVEVIALDAFTDYYPRWIKERNLAPARALPGCTFIEGDLRDLDLGPLLQGVEVVFHLAAQAGVRSSWGSQFQVYTRNNVLATQRLLEAAKDANSLRKFVYASSSSIYGDAEAFPTPESATPRPLSPYGVTKLAGEHLCQLYWHNYGVPTVSLRYFTVYGPRQRPDMAFHIFLRYLLEERPLSVFGDGEQTRDFTFIDDAVEANLLAAEKGPAGAVFNIGGGSRVTLRQAIRVMEQVTERKAQVAYQVAQKGDVRHTSANIALSQRLLGYTPRVTLAEGLAQEARWLEDLLRHAPPL